MDWYADSPSATWNRFPPRSHPRICARLWGTAETTQAREFAGQLGPHAAFEAPSYPPVPEAPRTSDHEGVVLGFGLLRRWPITSLRRVELPARHRTAPRADPAVIVSGQGGKPHQPRRRRRKESPMTEHPYDIEITRVFDAPPERVYQAFTDPDQFARWYGPVGFPVHRDTVEVDARGRRAPAVRDGERGRPLHADGVRRPLRRGRPERAALE